MNDYLKNQLNDLVEHLNCLGYRNMNNVLHKLTDNNVLIPADTSIITKNLELLGATDKCDTVLSLIKTVDSVEYENEINKEVIIECESFIKELESNTSKKPVKPKTVNCKSILSYFKSLGIYKRDFNYYKLTNGKEILLTYSDLAGLIDNKPSVKLIDTVDDCLKDNTVLPIAPNRFKWFLKNHYKIGGV